MKKKEKTISSISEKSVFKMTVCRILLRIMISGLIILHPGFIKAQTATVTINKENDVIEDILREIQRQTGFNYLLNHEEIPEGAKVTVKERNATIDKVLNHCLKGLPLTYKIVDNVIIIMPLPGKKNRESDSEDRLSQTIRGRVIDRESEVSLPGANITLLDSDPLIGAVSDTNGYFRLEKAPVGRHTIKVSYIGYKDLVLPEILVGSAKEVILTIRLFESIEDINEVVIRLYEKGTPRNEMATVSSRSFSVEESQRYAGSIGDPGRMALSFAGVNTDDDVSNQIVIRGNSPNTMLWRLEGVQIPIPNHFCMEGWSAGYVSLLSTKMLGPSDFFTGAFPAEYGNTTSGVFDMTFRNGNNEKHENTFEIGVLGADLSTEGPFSKNCKGSYLLNYRYATFSLMNLFGIRIQGSLLPEYSDLSFKFYLPTKKAGAFSIWGMGGKAFVEDRYSIIDSLDIETQYINEQSSRMGAAGITHTFFPGNKSYFKTILSCSGNSSLDETFITNNDNPAKLDYHEKLSSSALRFSSYYNRKMTSKLSLKTGFILSKLYYDYYSKYIDPEYDTDIYIVDIDGKGNSETYQGFFQSKYHLTPDFTVNAGVHYLQFGLNNKYSIEPRAGFRWEFGKSHAINGGVGIHSRHEYLMHYFTKVEDEKGDFQYSNKNLDLQKSTHYVLGYTKMFNKELRLQMEVYYQSLSGLAVSADSSKTWSLINDDIYGFKFVSKGTGRNYGLELTLEKYFTDDYYFLITGSLFSSKYKPLDGRWYNTRYNNNYIINIVGGKEYRIHKKNILGLNGRFIWSGGRRATPIDEERVKNGEYVTDQKRRYELQFEPYLRLDVGVSYKINKPKVSHEFSLDIQNVTSRLNIGGSYGYNEETHEYNKSYLQGIIPVINYTIHF